jgi:hypothetical protein
VQPAAGMTRATRVCSHLVLLLLSSTACLCSQISIVARGDAHPQIASRDLPPNKPTACCPCGHGAKYSRFFIYQLPSGLEFIILPLTGDKGPLTTTLASELSKVLEGLAILTDDNVNYDQLWELSIELRTFATIPRRIGINISISRRDVLDSDLYLPVTLVLSLSASVGC